MRWVIGTNVITCSLYKSSKLHLGEIKYNQYNGVYLEFKLNRLCSTMPHYTINKPSLYFNWPARGRQRRNSNLIVKIHDIIQRTLIFTLQSEQSRTVQGTFFFVVWHTWEHISLLIQYIIYMHTFFDCSVFLMFHHILSLMWLINTIILDDSIWPVVTEHNKAPVMLIT